MGGSARWTILRNGLYAELLALFAVPDPEGRLTAPLGDGRLAAVAREDLADAAVRVVTSASSHAARTYELVGEEAIGGEDLARLLTEAAGTPVPFEPGTLAGAREAITASGAAAFQVPMLLSTLSAIAGGFMGATGSDLAGLLGRPRVPPSMSSPPRCTRGRDAEEGGGAAGADGGAAPGRARAGGAQPVHRGVAAPAPLGAGQARPLTAAGDEGVDGGVRVGGHALGDQDTDDERDQSHGQGRAGGGHVLHAARAGRGAGGGGVEGHAPIRPAARPRGIGADTQVVGREVLRPREGGGW